MVLLHVKRANQEFLLDTPLATRVEDAARQAAELFNLQQRAIRLATDAERAVASAPNREGLLSALAEVTAAVDNSQTGRRTALSVQALQQPLERVRAALAACFPDAAPPVELLSLLDSCRQPGSAPVASSELDPASATLYFGSRALQARGALRDCLGGTNERSKVVVKLQERGAGPPPREAQLGSEDEKAMLAWWHRKQEEQRRAGVAGREVDAGCDSAAWANPRALKETFVGMGPIRLR